MRGGLCVLTPFCDRITIQNPVKVVYRCRTPPYLTCIFRKKPSTFTPVRIIQEKSVRALFLRTCRYRYFGRSGTGTRTNFSILYGRGFTYVLIFIIFLRSDVHQTITDVLKNSYKFKNNKIQDNNFVANFILYIQ